MKTLVNFETAKLLKEKGFDSENCKQGYHGDLGYLEDDIYPFLGTYTFIEGSLIRNSWEYKIQTPTIAEVVIWLYENYGLWIKVDSEIRGEYWFPEVQICSTEVWKNSDMRDLVYEVNSSIREKFDKSIDDAYGNTIEKILQHKNFKL